MTTNTITTARAASIVIPEGYTTRVGAQTASRDYTAKVLPGIYPIEYTTASYYQPVSADSPAAYWANVRVTIDAPERWESTVEFGGVALASQKVEATRELHTLGFYAYQFEQGSDSLARLIEATGLAVIFEAGE